MYQLVKRLGKESVYTCILPFGALVFMSLVPSTLNATSATSQADMFARINEALQTQTESGFDFGSIVPTATGNSSTLSVNPDGVRACPSPLVCSGDVSSASLTVRGTPLTQVTFSYPDAVNLRSGMNGLQMSNIHDSLDGICELDAEGKCLVSFGASLEVSPNQPIGAYIGTIAIQVEYN